jgi:hypothetical protein
MTNPNTVEFLVKFPPCATYEEAVGWQTFYYDYTQYPIDPSKVAEVLNEHFGVTNFRQGRPRGPGEMAVAIKWPRHRKERKPIKMVLQEGVLLHIDLTGEP